MGALKVLLRHRRLAVVFHFVLALAMLPGIMRLGNDNSPEVFFARDAGALAHYRFFRQEFGGGKAVRVAVTGRGLWTEQGLVWLGEVEERIASLPGVESAVGLPALHGWLLLQWPPSDPPDFRARVLKSRLDLDAGWVSPDGDTVSLLVGLADLPPSREHDLLNRLDKLIAKPPPGIRAHLSGLPVFRRAMDHSMVNIVAFFLPLLVFLAVVFLAVTFRRPRDMIVPLLFVGVCQVILFGIMGYAGERLNLVTVVLPVLLLVISLATAVHILVRFRRLEQRGMQPADAVLATYRSKMWPVLWTGITTFAAFGSLVTAGMPPARFLGLWSALGIALMTILAFTFYPALLSGNMPPAARNPNKKFLQGVQGGGFYKKSPPGRWGRVLAHWAVQRRFPVLAATAVLMAAALLGMARLQVHDNLGTYFPARHPVRAELERLQRHGVGVYAAELVLTYRSGSSKGNKQERGFQDPWSQQRLARLTRVLRSEPLVYGVLSSGDLVEAAVRSMLVEGEVDDNIRWMALGMMQTVPESRKLLHALVTPDGQSARLTLLVPMLSFNRIQPLFERAAARAGEIFPDADAWVTGQYPLILMAQKSLLYGLISSFSLTLLCVVLVFYLVLRRIRLTFLVLVPNLWPIALVLGGMGWLRIPLDSVSVMSASVVLGLAVDDTFHTLGYYLRLVPRCSPGAAIETTLERTAPAHLLTTVILVSGFFACAFSDFLPVSRMGAISAVAIILALVGDLVLIPALLACGGHSRKKTQRGD